MRLTTSALLVLSTAAAGAADRYEVDCRIHSGDALLAAPIVIVEDGKTARVAIGDDLEYQLTVRGAAGSTVLVTTDITVDGSSYRPSLQVELGEVAVVELEALHLSLSVTPAAES